MAFEYVDAAARQSASMARVRPGSFEDHPAGDRVVVEEREPDRVRVRSLDGPLQSGGRELGVDPTTTDPSGAPWRALARRSPSASVKASFAPGAMIIVSAPGRR
jgi:hypothetical protein